MPVDFETFRGRTNIDRGVIVVAPHPDDECAGTGGLLALCAGAGIAASVVVVTDGGASHPNSQSWPRHRLTERREAETKAALLELGIGEPPVFLGLPDAGTPNLPNETHVDARKKLREVVAKRRPGLVLTTWRREPHCDHRYAYRLARQATEDTDVQLAEYVVWTPIIGAPDDAPRAGEGQLIELDIERVRDWKRRALNTHESQLGHVIDDDPDGFVLNEAQFAAMTGPTETYLL